MDAICRVERLAARGSWTHLEMGPSLVFIRIPSLMGRVLEPETEVCECECYGIELVLVPKRQLRPF